MERDSHLGLLFKNFSESIEVQLQPDQISKFITYHEQLRIWNQSINLTSIIDDEEVVIKHFVDSLAGLKAENIAPDAQLLDVGTGAGFPGIPLRIIRQDLDLTLIEPVQKKVSFLNYIVGTLRLDRVKIYYGTFEMFMKEDRPYRSFNYITSRALKYEVILRNARPMLSRNGKIILYLSHSIDKQDLGMDWSILKEFKFDLPKGLGRRVISVLSAS